MIQNKATEPVGPVRSRHRAKFTHEAFLPDAPPHPHRCARVIWSPFPRRLTCQAGQDATGRHLDRQPGFALVRGNHRLPPAHRTRHVHRQIVRDLFRLPEHAPGAAAQVRTAWTSQRDGLKRRRQLLCRSASSSQWDGTLTASLCTLLAPFRGAFCHLRHPFIGSGNDDLRFGIQVSNIRSATLDKLFHLRQGLSP